MLQWQPGPREQIKLVIAGLLVFGSWTLRQESFRKFGADRSQALPLFRIELSALSTGCNFNAGLNDQLTLSEKEAVATFIPM